MTLSAGSLSSLADPWDFFLKIKEFISYLFISRLRLIDKSEFSNGNSWKAVARASDIVRRIYNRRAEQLAGFQEVDRSYNIRLLYTQVQLGSSFPFFTLV